MPKFVITVEGEPFGGLSCKQNFKPKTLLSQCFRSVSDLLLSDWNKAIR